MKRIIASVVILVICVVFAAFGSIYIENSLSAVLDALEAGGGTDIWEEKKETLSVLLKHEDIDAVDEEITAMKRYLENGNADDAEECRTRAQSYIQSIIDGEKLNIGNVF